MKTEQFETLAELFAGLSTGADEKPLVRREHFGAASQAFAVLSTIEDATPSSVDLSDYYTRDQVDSLIAEAVDGIDIPEVPEVDLSNYYTKDQVDTLIAGVSGGGGAVDSVFGRVGAVVAVAGDYDAFYYTETELDAGQLDTRYYTETEVDALIAGLAAVYAPIVHNHDTRYYTEAELDAGQLDNRYYTETEVDTLLASITAGDIDAYSIRRYTAYIFKESAASWGSLGTPTAVAGTPSSPILATTNALTKQNGLVMTTATTNAQPAIVRANEVIGFLDKGVKFRAIFGQTTNINTGRYSVGLGSNTVPINSDPSSQFDLIIVGYDAGDSSGGNWQLMHNDGSGTATKVDTGIARSTTGLYRLEIDSADGTSYSVRIVDLSTGTVAFSTTISTNLPTLTVGTRIHAAIRNGTVSGGVSAAMFLSYLYCELGQE